MQTLNTGSNFLMYETVELEQNENEQWLHKFCVGI